MKNGEREREKKMKFFVEHTSDKFDIMPQELEVNSIEEFMTWVQSTNHLVIIKSIPEINSPGVLEIYDSSREY